MEKENKKQVRLGEFIIEPFRNPPFNRGWKKHLSSCDTTKTISYFDLPSSNEKSRLTGEYIRGFIDGEGHLTIAIKKGTKKQKEQTFLIFGISQTGDRGKEVLIEIMKFFKCGSIIKNEYENDKWSTCYKYAVQSFNEIFYIIIPFLNIHPLIIKKEEYKVWKEVAYMMKNGEHLTFEGRKTIKQLKEKSHELKTWKD